MDADGLQAEGTGERGDAAAPGADGAGGAVPAAGREAEPEGTRGDERRLQPPARAGAGAAGHHPGRRRHGAQAARGADEARLRQGPRRGLQEVHQGEANRQED